MILLKHILIFTFLLSAVSAKSFLNQLLSWNFDLGKTTEKRADADPAPVSNCVCDGPGCICCTDFNLTYIDLGGPGCVRLKYLSPEEGMAVNVSYGSSLLHSEVVKGPNPEPTCMNILTDLAQVCARFSEISPTSDGVRGCLKLEPLLLGESQAEYELGCFRVGPEGMTFDPPANNTKPDEGVNKPSGEVEEEETEEGPSEEEVIAAVNETAEQGLAFLSSLLGFDLGGSGQQSATNETSSTTETSASSTVVESPATSQGRAYNPHINEVE